jgi:hypothetical protein
MGKHANEIRSVIARLERTGEYDQFSSSEADRTTAEVTDLLAATLTLSDDDADALWSRDAGSHSDLTQKEHEERAQQAVREVRKSPISREEVTRTQK